MQNAECNLELDKKLLSCLLTSREHKFADIIMRDQDVS
jgi:hypothetical protein